MNTITATDMTDGIVKSVRLSGTISITGATGMTASLLEF